VGKPKEREGEREREKVRKQNTYKKIAIVEHE